MCSPWLGFALRISWRSNGGNRNVLFFLTGAVKKEITRYALARGVMRRVTSFAAAASLRYSLGYDTTALVRQCWLSMETIGRPFLCPAWQVRGSKSVMTRSIFHSSTRSFRRDMLFAACGTVIRFLAMVSL